MKKEKHRHSSPISRMSTPAPSKRPSIICIHNPNYPASPRKSKSDWEWCLKMWTRERKSLRIRRKGRKWIFNSWFNRISRNWSSRKWLDPRPNKGKLRARRSRQKLEQHLLKKNERVSIGLNRKPLHPKAQGSYCHKAISCWQGESSKSQIGQSSIIQ